MFFSESNTYIVVSSLGEGCFGKVRKCIRMKDMKTVAIKSQKRHLNNAEQIQSEVESLRKLDDLDLDKCNIVQFEEGFFTDKYIHLVFEHLENSLQYFMGERQNRRLNLQEIRPIVCQLANALDHLSTLGIIHTDLKPDNVMLVNHREVPYKVKLIDFGLAIDVSAAKVGSSLQPNSYRSPEMILGLPFTEAIDMWSLGMMTVHMFLGKPLFNCTTKYGVLREIVETLGQPPDHMLCDGLNTDQYFKRERKSGSLWRLKTPKERNETLGKNMLRSLDDLLKIYPMCDTASIDGQAETSDKLMFVDILKKMLELDPKKRIKPSQLLRHPFISGAHLVPKRTFSPYFRRSCRYMQVCKHFLYDDIEVVCRSLGEPTSGAAHHIQSGGLPDVNSGLNPGLINEPHCQSDLNKMVGKKREGANYVGTVDETPCVAKGVGFERHSGGYAERTTSRQQQPDQRCMRTGSKRKSTEYINEQNPRRFMQSQTEWQLKQPIHYQAKFRPQWKLQQQQTQQQTQRQQHIRYQAKLRPQWKLQQQTRLQQHIHYQAGLRPVWQRLPNVGLVTLWISSAYFLFWP